MIKISESLLLQAVVQVWIFRSIQIKQTYQRNVSLKKIGTPKGVRFTEKQWGNQLLQFFPFQNVVMYGYLPLDHVAGRSDVFSGSF